MDSAWLSFGALFFVVLMAGREKVGIGVLSLALAWLIGRYAAGMEIPQILAAFPLSLFMVLFGVTLFFGLAAENGTLDRVAAVAMRLARGNARALPLIFFALALVLAMAGPGNIGAVAMLAPFAMAVGQKTGISPFFMTLMLVNGANAGAFSPFAPTGIIANQCIERIGLQMDPWSQIFLPSLLAQSFVALAWYLVLRARHRRGHPADTAQAGAESVKPPAPMDVRQYVTLGAFAVFILGALVFKADVGFLAISLAAVLMLVDAAEAKMIAKAVPWNIVMMVCGVSTLIQVSERCGGLGLLTDFLARVSGPSNATAVLAWVSGLVSSYSSSSGVVMPTFIPLVPGLIEKMGGGNPAALVSSINVGSHVVDVSPLSTLGALCIAAASAHTDKNRLFRRLLVCGLSMSFFGAAVCYIFFGLLMK